MSRVTPSQVLKTLTVIAAGGFVLWSVAGKRSMPGVHSGELITGPVNAQIEEDIQAAVSQNRKAQTLTEWRSSGYTPTDIFQNVRALHSTAAWKALCQALLHLEPRDLILFSNEIHAKENRNSIPCTYALEKKSADFWKAQEASLPAFPAPKHPEKEPSLATIEKVVDPASDGSVNQQFLAPREVALSFNGGPSIEGTPEVMNALKRHGLRSNFFVTGQMVEAYPVLAERLSREGHTVGTLGWSEADFPRLDMHHAEEELEHGRDKVRTISHAPVSFFQFPFGDSTENVEQMIQDKSMATVSWNIDSQDWKIREPKELLRHVMSELERQHGGIILLHDSYQQTAMMLPELIHQLQSKQYSNVVFVSQPSEEVRPQKVALAKPISRFRQIRKLFFRH